MPGLSFTTTTKKMKLYTTALFFSLILFACSSDPCETLSCVNGSCIDGTCLCEEGFAGELCNELACESGTFENGKCQCPEGVFGAYCNTRDLTGVFVMTKLLLEDCPSYDPQYDLSGPASENDLCGLNQSETEVCFSYNYTIFNESQLFKAEVIRVDNAGEKEVTHNLLLAGSYKATNDELLIVFVDGTQETLTIRNNQLINTRKLSDGGSPDCTVLQEFSFSVDL